MELSAVQELLDQIRTVSEDLSSRRGRHAAALWAVHDFIQNLSGDLVPYRDVAPIHGASVLEIAPCDSMARAGGRWGLYVVDGAESQLAHKAEPHVQVAAVRRIGEFLAGFVAYLKEAAGSRVSSEIAEQLVRATAPVIQSDG